MISESVWNGFRRLDFLFEGKEAILVIPDEPTEGKNWLLKTEYFDAFPAVEIEMVKRGWHLAYVKNVTRWCLDEDNDRKKRFADFLSSEYGLAKKCTPVGMSCGGMIACKLAAKYPEIISALYIDAPVMNLLSCPCGIGAGSNNAYPEFVEATGMTIIDLMSYREHPIDKMHLLLKENIPIIMVYGDSDSVVPYSENGALLEKCYREGGGTLVAIGKEGCGHHPHCLPDNTPIIEFIEKYSK